MIALYFARVSFGLVEFVSILVVTNMSHLKERQHNNYNTYYIILHIIGFMCYSKYHGFCYCQNMIDMLQCWSKSRFFFMHVSPTSSPRSDHPSARPVLSRSTTWPASCCHEHKQPPRGLEVLEKPNREGPCFLSNDSCHADRCGLDAWLGLLWRDWDCDWMGSPKLWMLLVFGGKNFNLVLLVSVTVKPWAICQGRTTPHQKSLGPGWSRKSLHHVAPWNTHKGFERELK